MYLSLFSIFAFIYGIVMGILLIAAPHKLTKYEYMKTRYGNTKGKIVFVFCYVALPILFGLILLYRNFQFVPK